MSKKIKKQTKIYKSSRNLRKLTKKQYVNKSTKRSKRSKKAIKQKAGMFLLKKTNFEDAYRYLDNLLDTYTLYKYILDKCQITTRAIDDFGVNLIVDLNITDTVRRRHHISDNRYTTKDIIFDNNKPLVMGTEKIRNLSNEHILRNFQDFEKYQDLLTIIEDCLKKLHKNIINYNTLKEAIKKSKIPNLIETMRVPVSDSIKNGRETHLNQTIVMSNIAVSEYYENYQSKIKQDGKEINIDNFTFMQKCEEISNVLVLPHREFEQNSIGFPVGKGGGNLFVEFGCLEDILKFDEKIMLFIKDDIQYIIDKCKEFFGKNDIYTHLKKRNMQDYFRRNSTGYAPVNYNTKSPAGRYRFIQDMHKQGLQNAFNNKKNGLTILNPDTLRQKGIYRRGSIDDDDDDDDDEFFDA